MFVRGIQNFYYSPDNLLSENQSATVFRRCSLCIAAWSTGFTISSSMFTCGGRLATQTRISATSSATSGWVPS